MQPDNLISLKDDMVAFIAGHGMRRLNAYVTEDVPTVIFEVATDWYDSFQNLMETVSDLGSIVVDNRESDE